MTTTIPPRDLFADHAVDLSLLRQRAYNGRWAAHPPGIIPLTAADPDFPVAPEIRAAVQDYVQGGYFSYGPPTGLPEFRQTMAETIADRKGIACSAELVLPTNSAAAAMFLVARYALAPGDEAILFDPLDFLFGAAVDAAGGRRVYSPVDKATGAFDVDGLSGLITERTRLICLCNPHNPIGRALTRPELQAIGELAVRYNLSIMSDEIWSDIIYRPHKHTSIASLSPEIASRTISIYGLSKSHGLAGLRIGFLVAPDSKTYAALLNLSRAETTADGVSTVSQVAAMAAYRDCWYWVEAFLEHLARVRTYAVARLRAMPGVRCLEPEGTYVLFPDITGTGLDSAATAAYLLDQAKVAVVPGLPRWFGPGAEGHIRLCFSTSMGIMADALDRVEAALDKLPR